MPFNYNPLTNPSANIIALLREQNDAGTEYGKFAGAEPLEVLFAKAIFNANANGSSSGGTWGSIVGTLADQIDLWDELQGKQDVTDNLTDFVALLGANGSINDGNLTGTTTVENLEASNANVTTITINRTLPVDNTSSGFIVAGLNAGATIAQWDAVYLDFSDGELKLADANGAGTYPAVGLAISVSSDGSPVSYLINGWARNDAWSWSAGAIFLSTTAGGLTQTAPSTSTNIVQPVGWAVSAGVAYFNFNQPYYEVT